MKIVLALYLTYIAKFSTCGGRTQSSWFCLKNHMSKANSALCETGRIMKTAGIILDSLYQGSSVT
jgi:hypothetical protein